VAGPATRLGQHRDRTVDAGGDEAEVRERDRVPVQAARAAENAPAMRASRDGGRSSPLGRRDDLRRTPRRIITHVMSHDLAVPGDISHRPRMIGAFGACAAVAKERRGHQPYLGVSS
jgi:hypothetical protein